MTRRGRFVECLSKYKEVRLPPIYEFNTEPFMSGVVIVKNRFTELYTIIRDAE
jgi:hypothetical protein